MNFVDLAALTIHDVKNRLAILAARAEGRGDTETLRGLLESADTLTGLLAFYKAEQGEMRPDIDAHCPADLVADLQGEASRLSSFSIGQLVGEAPALGFYDENLIRLVLAHAVHNALRFARHEIRLGATGDAEWLVFAVQDDGPGFAPEILAGEPSTAKGISREGTGIGLRLARRVAAMHRHGERCGRVELLNAPGGVFRLYLPV